MSLLDLYHRKQKEDRQSRADKATSWRTSCPTSTSGISNSFFSQTSDTRVEYPRSIWTQISNDEPSSDPYSFYGERQENVGTGVASAVTFYDNNASDNLVQLLSSLSLYSQDEDIYVLTQTEAVGEQPLLDKHNGIQVNSQYNSNPWSQVPNIVNEEQNVTPGSRISWTQVPNIVNQEHVSAFNASGNHTWSQIVSGDAEEALNSSGTLNTGEDTIVDEAPSPARGVRYISESNFTTSLNGAPAFSVAPPPKAYMVLKIQNIPWYSSINDIKRLLSRDFVIPSVKEHPLSVHVLMDRCTGKTCGIAFAEVTFKSRNMIALRDAINRLERSPLQGRRLRICLSSYDHLREKLFYDWPGEFKDGVAVSSSNERDHLARNPDLFVCQKDFQSIQNVCRNFKLCYNRKCPERSFEYLMSLVMNIPWLQTRTVVTWQRDLMYESYKLATDTLRLHTSKPLHTIDDELLPLFVRAALLCDGFTIKQKFNILTTSKLSCPEDLLGYVTEVEPVVSPEQYSSTPSNTTL